MDLNSVRPSTPNTVMYDSDMARPETAKSLKSLAPPPPPMAYNSPPDSARDAGMVAGGNHPHGRGIWTVEGNRIFRHDFVGEGTVLRPMPKRNCQFLSDY